MTSRAALSLARTTELPCIVPNEYPASLINFLKIIILYNINIRGGFTGVCTPNFWKGKVMRKKWC